MILFPRARYRKEEICFESPFASKEKGDSNTYVFSCFFPERGSPFWREAAYASRRGLRTRPLNAALSTPSFKAISPLTITASNPAEYCFGS